MRYVRRNAEGLVDGHFAHPNAQAQELMPEDHPEILDFTARSQDIRTLKERLDTRLRKSVYARGMMRLLAKRLGMTEDEVYDEIYELGKDE